MTRQVFSVFLVLILSLVVHTGTGNQYYYQSGNDVEARPLAHRQAPAPNQTYARPPASDVEAHQLTRRRAPAPNQGHARPPASGPSVPQPAANPYQNVAGYQTGSPGPGAASGVPPPQHHNNERSHPLPPLTPEPPPGSLIAYIHMHGVTGYLLLTPGTTTVALIRGRIAGSTAQDTFNWKIYSKPTREHTSSCSTLDIGHMLYDLTPQHGAIPLDRDLFFPSNLNLMGLESVMGRSVVLESQKTGIRICATLLPATKKATFEAKLHYPLAGLVRLMQTPVRTGIFVEFLLYSDGQRKDSLHPWSLTEGRAEDAEPDARVKHEQERCAKLKGTHIFAFDSREGDEIPVSTEMPLVKGRSYQTIRALKPFTAIPVVYLLIHDESDSDVIIACAALRFVKPKAASAKFTAEEIQGTIKLSQETPYDPTVVEADLELRSKAFSYGIDVLPTIRRRKVEQKKCPNVKEIIFNPFRKNPEEVPPQGSGSTDQFAVGDLSGKYGTLYGKDKEQFTLLDFNLPLFGYYSVVGRAVVVYAPNGPAIGCANIDLSEDDITTVYATFDVPLQGQFIFRQSAGDCQDDVYVYIEISKPDGKNVEKTFNHLWHVHEKPVKAGFEHLSSTDCASGGGHLNPFNTSKECIYVRDCNAVTFTRCEVGDSAGKLAPIDIPPYKSSPTGEPEVGKYYFVDSDLPLCGSTSIVGRSVIIHAEDFAMARLTCANLLEFKPKA